MAHQPLLGPPSQVPLLRGGCHKHVPEGASFLLMTTRLGRLHPWLSKLGERRRHQSPWPLAPGNPWTSGPLPAASAHRGGHRGTGLGGVPWGGGRGAQGT